MIIFVYFSHCIFLSSTSNYFFVFGIINAASSTVVQEWQYGVQ